MCADLGRLLERDRLHRRRLDDGARAPGGVGRPDGSRGGGHLPPLRPPGPVAGPDGRRRRRVPVADPELEEDPRWLGVPFMVMPRVTDTSSAHWPTGTDGSPPVVLRTRRRSTPTCWPPWPTSTGGPRAVPDVPRATTAASSISGGYLQWSSDGDPVPALVDAVTWCRRHRPSAEAPAACCGGTSDSRTR